MRARYHGAGSEMRAGDITHSCTRLLTGSARLGLARRPLASLLLASRLFRYPCASPPGSSRKRRSRETPVETAATGGSVPFETRLTFSKWRPIDKSRGTLGPGDRGIPRQVCTYACVRALISNGLTEGPAGRSGTPRVPRSPFSPHFRREYIIGVAVFCRDVSLRNTRHRRFLLPSPSPSAISFRTARIRPLLRHPPLANRSPSPERLSPNLNINV